MEPRVRNSPATSGTQTQFGLCVLGSRFLLRAPRTFGRDGLFLCLLLIPTRRFLLRLDLLLAVLGLLFAGLGLFLLLLLLLLWLPLRLLLLLFGLSLWFLPRSLNLLLSFRFCLLLLYRSAWFFFLFFRFILACVTGNR